MPKPYWLILLCLISLFYAFPAAAQSEVTTPPINADCVQVERLMDMPLTPDKMIQGGDILQPNTPVQAEITAEDAGDRWLAALQGGSVLTIDVQSELELRVEVFQGLEALPTSATPPSDAIEVQIPTSGYYTIVISRQNISDTSVIGSYTLTVNGSFAAPISLEDVAEVNAAAVGVEQRWLFYNRFTSSQTSARVEINLESEIGLQVQVLDNTEAILSEFVQAGTTTLSAFLNHSGYYTLVISPTQTTGSYSFNLTTVRVGSPIRANLEPIQQPRWEQFANPPAFTATNGLLSADIGDNVTLGIPPDFVTNITVGPSVRLTFAGGDYFLRFVQNSTREVALVDGNLNIHLNNGGFVYVEDYPYRGQLIDDVSNFSALNLPNGQSVRVDWANAASTWILPDCMGVKLRTGQKLIGEGTTLNARPDQPITITGAVNYQLTVDWENLDRIIASSGLITLDFDSYQHTLVTDQLTLDVQRDTDSQGNIQQRITAAGNPYLTTDWENLRRIQSMGAQTLIEVLDSRQRIERTERTLQSVETQAGVMLLRWQDSSASLLMPESEDFIQIEIPPSAVSYGSTALPGDSRYLPVRFNNTGQECYPVNTAFEFNCAPNGEVNPANGNLSLAVTDLYARGYRLDLTLSRTYNSLNYQIDGAFGYGWNTDYLLDFDVPYDSTENAPRSRYIDINHDYQMALDLRQALRGQVILTTASGSHHLFQSARPGDAMTATTLPGWEIAARPRLLADGWAVHRSDGLVYEFDRAGRLRAIYHPHGGRLEVTRQQDYPNAIYRIQDDVGRSIELEFDADQHVIRSTLYDQTAIVLAENTYSYQDGLLTRVNYADGSQADYIYEDGQLISHTDPRAPIAATLYYDYDSSQRVTAISSEPPTQENRALYRAYSYTTGEFELLTTVRDEWGAETRWRYSLSPDAALAYQLLGTTQPGQEEITYIYDQNGYLVVGIDYPNYVLGIGYEPRGAITTISNLNAAIGFNAVYDDVAVAGHTIAALTEYRIDNEVQATYTYDNAGRVTSFTTSGGVETTVNERHPRFGLPTELEIVSNSSEPVPTQEMITLTYNDYGYLSSRQDGRGTYQFEWDSTGRLIALIDPLGRTYRLAYVDQCMIVTDPLAAQTRYCYDLRYNLIEKQVVAGDTFLQQINYAYDEFDRLIESRETIDETAAVTTYAYLSGETPGSWRLETVTPDGLSVTTEYDALDRVVQVIDKLGRETTYAYDAAGIVTQTDPNGETTRLEYNLANQICRLNYHDIEWQVYYDPTGTRCNEPRREPTRLVIPNRLDISFDRYDSEGRVEQVSYRVFIPGDATPETLAAAPPLTITYDYDDRGQLILLDKGQGENTVLTYAIDDNGQKIVTADSTSSDGTIQQTISTYDVLDRLIAVQRAEGVLRYSYQDLPEQHLLQVNLTFEDTAGATLIWQLFYNPLGSLIAWQNQDGVITRYEYDQASHLRRVTVNGRLQAEYTYNAVGQVISITNMNGKVRRFVYNNKGQLSTSRDFNNVVSVYTYDQSGNLSTVTDALGNTTTYLYDEFDRLTDIIDPIGRNQSFDWSDVPSGQLAYQDADNTIDYYFDLFGRLWQVQDDDNIRHFLRYDPSGRLTGFQPANRALNLTVGYGAGNTVTSLTDGSRWNWQYQYDALQRLTSRQDPDEQSLNFSYDVLGRFVSISAPNSQPLYERRYNYDEPGLVEVLLGNQVTEMRYDDFYRLLEQRVTNLNDSTPVPYTTTYEYGADESFTVTDPFGVKSTYTYVGLTGLDQEIFLTVEENATTWQYILNARGELVRVIREDTLEDATIYRREEEIRYNALGRPIRYIDAEGNLYAYTYDTNGNLATMQNPDGSRYSYNYDELHRLISIANPGNQVIRLEYNPLNQVERILLNNKPLESYTYSPLGQLLTRSFLDGASPSTITYQYSPAGHLSGWVDEDAAGIVIQRTADAFARPINLQDRLYNTPSVTTFAYDVSGAVITATTGSFGQNFTLDAARRVQNWRHLQTGEIWSYAYEGSGYTLLISADETRQIKFALDENLRLNQMSAGGEVIEVAYSLREGDTLEVTLTWGDGYSSQVRFDKLGHVVRVVHDRQGDISFSRAAFSYTLNYFGLPQSIDETVHDVFLGYDSAYRPLTTRWLYTGTDRNIPRDTIEYAFTLTYDDLGNRRTELQQNLQGTQRLYRYEFSNTLLRQRSPDTTPLNGAFVLFGIGAIFAARRRKFMIMAMLLAMPLVVFGATLSAQQNPPNGLEYKYNAAGHLTSIVDATAPEGQNPTQFIYDGYGRLVSSISPTGITSLFDYDPFGRLISWEHPTYGHLEYRYDGDNLAQISQAGSPRLVLSAADSPLLLLQGEQSEWALHDGLNTLRQSFVETHTDGSALFETDVFGVPLLPLADDELPLEIPVFDGMLYDPAANIYIGLDGRAYDATTGRYLQRDPLGPDASGSLYNYRYERAALPVQLQQPYPFTEGLEALIAAQSLPEALTAEAVIQQTQPRLSLGWYDAGFASLQAFNTAQFDALNQYADFPNWLAYQYNPPGAVIKLSGDFSWLAGGNTLPSGLASQPSGSAFAPDQMLAVLVPTLNPPEWYAPDQWRAIPSLDTNAPQPVTGSRPPDALFSQLEYPLNNLDSYADLFDALQNLPVKEADEWLAEIDAASLPTVPETLPPTAREWLENWFTNDTFPTWRDLREIYDLPDVPGINAPMLDLEG